MEDENFTQLVDPRLQFSYKNSEMARMVACAATCVRKSARHRPLMSQVFPSHYTFSYIKYLSFFEHLTVQAKALFSSIK